MPATINTKPNLMRSTTFWLAILAGLLYSSWPLGYLLNPGTAHVAFASKLEAADQPYNWLFIALDIASGVTMLVLGFLQWQKTTRPLLRLSIAAYGIFALLVIVAALAPYDCDSPSAQCTGAFHSSLPLVHGLASVVSVVALFLSLCIITLASLRQLRSRAGIILSFLGSGWGMCGVAALLYLHTTSEVPVQYAFISVCSVSFVASVGLIGRMPSPSRLRA